MIRMRHLLSLPLALGLLVLGSCGAPDTGSGAPRPHLSDQRLVRIIDGEPRALDPHIVSDNNSLSVARDQMEGLTRLNGAAQPEPGLAQSWRVSQNGLIWDFTLRPAIAFSDGTPITAQAVVDSIARLRNAETAYANAPLAEPIVDIFSPGPHQIRITLKAPFPQLPELLAHPAFATLPMHLVKSQGANWTQMRPLVTSGPYHVQSWALGRGVLLVRNPFYYDKARVAVPQILWVGMEDKEAALRRFRTGEAHSLNSVPSARVEQWRHLPHSPLRIAPYRATYYWVFNQETKPFDDVRVRRALQMTVEPQLITDKLLKDGARPAWTLIPPDVEGHVPKPPAWQSWPRAKRLATARALLQAAGYGPQRPLKFEARFNSDTDHKRIALALGQFWKELGVELIPYNSESAIHFNNLRMHQFAFARSGWIADVNARENFLYLHKSGANELNYGNNKDPVFDALLEQALAESQPEKRARMMEAAEARLIDQAVTLPIYFYVSRNMVSPQVIGWQDNLADIHPSRTLALRAP